MDGMLSQDEINALLNGMMDTGDSADGGAAAEGAADSTPSEAPAPAPASSGNGPDESLLTDVEKDAVGEVANISMGTSATTKFFK